MRDGEREGTGPGRETGSPDWTPPLCRAPVWVFFCLLGNSPAPPPPTAKPNGNHGAPPQPGLTRPNRNHGAPPQRLPLLPESPSQGKRDLSVSLTASLLPNNHRVQKLPPRYVWRTCPEPSPGQAPPGPSCSLSPSGGVGGGGSPRGGPEPRQAASEAGRQGSTRLQLSAWNSLSWIPLTPKGTARFGVNCARND